MLDRLFDHLGQSLAIILINVINIHRLVISVKFVRKKFVMITVTVSQIYVIMLKFDSCMGNMFDDHVF